MIQRCHFKGGVKRADWLSDAEWEIVGALLPADKTAASYIGF